MKKRYIFSTGEHIEADLEDLQRLLSDNKQYLENYEPSGNKPLILHEHLRRHRLRDRQ